MVGLIRPYLEYTAYHYARMLMTEASTVNAILLTLEDWMVQAIVRSAHTRLNITWEINIRVYLRNQREWNGFSEDFDWTVGDLTIPERVASCLQCFNVNITMDEMEQVRASTIISFDEYNDACRIVEKFWHILEGYEKFELTPYP
jgi:hypothetical protein